jgi:hypothetical protein
MEQQLIQTVEYQKKINPNGYILVNFEGEWVLEHRLIIENYIGRPLKTIEKVHHDNFLKQDNRIANLTLFPTGKQHNRFHRQIKQFSMTNPRRMEIERLKQLMESERSKNLGEIQ